MLATQHISNNACRGIGHLAMRAQSTLIGGQSDNRLSPPSRVQQARNAAPGLSGLSGLNVLSGQTAPIAQCALIAQCAQCALSTLAPTVQTAMTPRPLRNPSPPLWPRPTKPARRDRSVTRAVACCATSTAARSLWPISACSSA